MSEKGQVMNTKLAYGAMQRDELRMVRSIFERIDAEGLLPIIQAQRDEFAAYLMRMYFRSLVIEDKLYDLGVVAAKARYRLTIRSYEEFRFPVTRVLIVEDDYYLSSHLKKVFEAAGATVLGPVGREEDAMRLLGSDLPGLAVVDLNLGTA
jgi:hypothetical protein